MGRGSHASKKIADHYVVFPASTVVCLAMGWAAHVDGCHFLAAASVIGLGAGQLVGLVTQCPASAKARPIARPQSHANRRKYGLQRHPSALREYAIQRLAVLAEAGLREGVRAIRWIEDPTLAPLARSMAPGRNRYSAERPGPSSTGVCRVLPLTGLRKAEAESGITVSRSTAEQAAHASLLAVDIAHPMPQTGHWAGTMEGCACLR